MSRQDNKSLLVRGVPQKVLSRLEHLARDQRTTKNAIVLELIEDYANNLVEPKATPPPFDPERVKAQAHAEDTAPLSVSGIDPQIYGQFLLRSRSERWFSKNALIVELLRDATEG